MIHVPSFGDAFLNLCSSEQQKTRADELQQTCDQLRLTLITRTKVLFERSNRHSRPPRAHLADQVIIAKQKSFP